MSEPASILIIEDEPYARTLLQVTLGQQDTAVCMRRRAWKVSLRRSTVSRRVLLDLGLPTSRRRVTRRNPRAGAPLPSCRFRRVETRRAKSPR